MDAGGNWFGSMGAAVIDGGRRRRQFGQRLQPDRGVLSGGCQGQRLPHPEGGRHHRDCSLHGHVTELRRVSVPMPKGQAAAPVPFSAQQQPAVVPDLTSIAFKANFR